MAFNASQGPRVVPGDYTVRITKAGQVYTSQLTVGLDRRANFTVEDRKAQYDAVARAGDVFNRMSALVEKIQSVRSGADMRAAKADPALKARLDGLAGKADTLRKEIVATKEGGAITGEERLREHLDQLYGAINSYEGRPSDYQTKNLDLLDGQLTDLEKRFDALAKGDLVKVNSDLEKAKARPITVAAASPDATDAGGSQSVAALAGWKFSLRTITPVATQERD